MLIAIVGSQEPAVTVTNYKTVTSCSGPAPTCASSAASASITGIPSGYTVSTVYSTKIDTITQCPATVKHCPARSTHLTTSIIPVTTTICPITAEHPVPSSTASFTEVISTIYSTKHIVVTSCAATVLKCPARHTMTLFPISTTKFTVPVTAVASATAVSEAVSAVESEATSYFTNYHTVTSCPAGVSCPASTAIVAPASVASASASPVASVSVGFSGQR